MTERKLDITIEALQQHCLWPAAADHNEGVFDFEGRNALLVKDHADNNPDISYKFMIILILKQIALRMVGNVVTLYQNNSTLVLIRLS